MIFMCIFASENKRFDMSFFKHNPCHVACLMLLLGAAVSCNEMADVPDFPSQQDPDKKQISFPVTVTRDGQSIPAEAISEGGGSGSGGGIGTRSGGFDSGNMIATMDASRPFGLIGIDELSGTLLLDNVSVSSNSSNVYSGMFDSGLWDIPTTVSFSAYYPYVSSVSYNNGYASYNIPFSGDETEAGPLVSKTVERALDQLNMVPLEFQHITNDIGFKICDVTSDPQLQGLIHLRKATATNVASAGVFVNDIALGRGNWRKQGYYRDVVLFEGDALVGVGMDNEKFIGWSTLEDHLAGSHRYYSVPDDILMGKQCVELVYDVDGFTMGGLYYEPLPGQVARYMLYGVLPDNVFEYGKQYTFHLGLDTGKLYNQIAFSASVGEWETKIFENNDDF